MHQISSTRRGSAALALLLPLSFLTFCAAKADAPTHRLAIAAKSIKTDCANGQCTPACSLTGTLTNVGHGPSVPVQVSIWFADTSTDAGETAVTLGFPALQVKQSNTTSDEAMHYTCDKVVVKRVEVVCPETGSDEKCPGFYNVAVPDVGAPKIKRQNVEGK